MQKVLDKIEIYILYVVVFLIPITILPISPSIFVVPKLAILAFGVCIMLFIKAARVIYSGNLNLRTGKYDLPVALIAIAYLVSTIARTPNKMEALLLPGTATIIICSSLLYFLVNQLKSGQKGTLLKVLFSSATVFSVITLLSFSGILAKIPQLPAIMRAQGFTPEGGFLPAVLFLIPLVPLGIGLAFAEKNAAQKSLLAVALITVVLGLAISIWNIIPGKQFAPKFPSYTHGWSIAVDTLKESPLLGVGPGNYLTAFNRYRPLSFNQSELWAVKFATARSFYLTVLTEAGMLGIAGVILLLLAVYRTLQSDIKGKSTPVSDTQPLQVKKLASLNLPVNLNSISLILLLALLVFAPATLIIITTTFILLALVTKTGKTTLDLKTQGVAGVNTIASRLPAILVSLPIIIATLLFGYHTSRTLAAEYTFNKAINALSRNDAQETYDLMIKAVNLNPRVDRYHSTYSRVNLALANSIALQATTPPTGPEAAGTETAAGTITETDRANIAQLVQQAIREAKATVALNPQRSGNWETLASVYRAIMPLATGSDVFAIQTYTQAIALDPINPNLRVSLGGIHYGRGDFDNAVKVLELATIAKPDHANAHYNLAFALREAGQLDRAINEMTAVLSLIDRTTDDYEIARQALESMQERKAAQAPPGPEATGEQLTPPQGEQEPVIQPPLELPEESEPPEPLITPTPTPSAEEEGEDVTSTITPPQPTPTPSP